MKKNYAVGLITDATDLSAKLNKEMGLYDHFDSTVISCEVGYKKPEKEIFLIALSKLKLPANECVFIDDREEHLNMPKELGFHVVHFKNNEQLINDLKNLGVSIS